jgi:hypothetical protein
MEGNRFGFIDISMTEWIMLQKYTGTFSGRKKFLSKFDKYFSQKLKKKFQINCTYKCTNNWFLRLASDNVWHGDYQCVNNKCNFKLEAFIKKIDDKELSVVIYITFNQSMFTSPFHDELEIKLRCAGGERTEQSNFINKFGLLINQSENVINNHYSESVLDKKPINHSVLKAIKYECRHTDRFSSNHITDVQAAKTVMENTFLNVGNLKGYIHEICADPFGFILISSLQVRFFFI